MGEEVLSRTDAGYTARDVKENAGLSYRQLAVWEQRGAIPLDKRRKEGWRKFSLKEVFGLMVCAEVRRQFGVPLESLRWLRAQLFRADADYLRAAAEKMELGFSVWILTDLRETFVLDSDLEIEDLLTLGFLRVEDSKSLILVHVNPLANKLLACHKPPISFKIHDEYYAKLRAIRNEGRIQTADEQEILRLIRGRNFKGLTVHLRNRRTVKFDAAKRKRKEQQ